MKIANADKLKQHFENVVDVKLFTVPNILTIIDTFSIDVNDGDLYEFGHDGDAPIMTNLTEKQRQRDIFKDEGRWTEVDGADGDSYYECSNCGEPWVLSAGTPEDNNMHYCPNCGAKMRIGGTEP